jgi:outer membrane lipoprotein-sorting protein
LNLQVDKGIAMKLVASLLLVCALAVVSCVATPTYADQPRMEAALRSLQEARQHLAQATHDKGGHRAEALQAVDRAIAQTRKGIEYDRRVLSPNENRK